MSASEHTAPEGAGAERGAAGGAGAGFWWAAGVAWASLLWVAWSRQLAPDEAYYWVWSRHMALSYFDHPPMVAWLIRLSCAVLGETELAVRAPGVLLALGSVPLVSLAARWAGAGGRGTALGAALAAASPVAFGVGAIATPDGPAWFLGAAAVALAVAAASGEGRQPARWAGFGLVWGLALLSKYTAVLVGPGVLLALLSGARGRALVRTPWPWAGVLVAGAVFSPVVVWNAAHEWASFRFQLGHGLNGGALGGVPGAALRVGAYLGGQVAVCTPVLAVLAVGAVLGAARGPGKLEEGRRVLLWCGVLPLLAFGASALRRSPEMNWPALAYAPLMALVAVEAGEAGGRGRWTALARAAAPVALAFSIAGLHADQLVRLGLPLRHGYQLFGYRELGARIGEARRGPVFANRYQDASEAAFYTPGRPEVWALNGGGSRPNAFDYFAAAPDPGGAEEATFVNVPPEAMPPGFEVAEELPVPTVIAGRVVRTDRITVAAQRAQAVTGSRPSAAADR